MLYQLSYVRAISIVTETNRVLTSVSTLTRGGQAARNIRTGS